MNYFLFSGPILFYVYFYLIYLFLTPIRRQITAAEPVVFTHVYAGVSSPRVFWVPSLYINTTVINGHYKYAPEGVFTIEGNITMGLQWLGYSMPLVYFAEMPALPEAPFETECLEFDAEFLRYFVCPRPDKRALSMGLEPAVVWKFDRHMWLLCTETSSFALTAIHAFAAFVLSLITITAINIT